MPRIERSVPQTWTPYGRGYYGWAVQFYKTTEVPISEAK
jgi:hypothetical protein